MKLLCIGRNYAAHIGELHHKQPQAPIVFIKPDSAVLPKAQDFYIPEFSSEVHYEVEVLVKIKKVGKHIAPQFAPNYYDDISVGIDFTARDLQSQLQAKGLPWEKAKGFDGAAVVGAWRPKSYYKSVDALHFALFKNGEKVQKGNTALMLWKIDALIAYVSTYFTLKKGDLLFTGTPAGVGKVQPNDYLSGTLEGEQLFEIGVK